MEDNGQRYTNRMNILGINQVSGLLTWQHDGAAALVKDGKIIATAEEERFNRQRHAKGFPKMAIEYCLKEGGITLKDVDVIAVGYNPTAFLSRFFFYRSAPSVFTAFSTILLYRLGLRDIKKASGARIVYVDHHLAHAASAYRCAGFAEANAIIIDGAGETETASLFEGRNGKLVRRARIDIAKWYDAKPWRSVGLVYTRMTSFLSLGAHGEGKTMGLASYGQPRFDFSSILNVRSWSNYTIDRRNIARMYSAYERKDSSSEITQDQKDLAASLQKALEDAVVNMGKDAHRMTGLRHFVLAGGVTLNCNANSQLLAQDFCDDLFVQPAANDGGIALGAALEVMHEVGDADFVDFPNSYWGPGFTNEEIEVLLKEAKVSYKKSEDIAADAAALVASGKIIAWFQGRMEAGPRALGNRSILANPCKEGMDIRVNEEIKHRETWRPFAPSVVVESASDYFEGVEKTHASPYMLHTFYVREKYRSVFPAITHVDGSSRIQTVSSKQNPRYYAYLKALEKHTGYPMTMNTSFNDKGEPIICSPRDALRCYFSTGIDALAIGDFLLEKPHANVRA